MIFSRATGVSGRVVDYVFLYILVICLILLALITFLMVYFVIHYRRAKHPQPVDIEGSTWLEILWTVVPTLLVLTMFYYGLTGFDFLRKVPLGAMTVKVIARQWSWLFQYDMGIEDAQLTVPVGKPVELLLTSLDVIHGFYAPAFRIKQDAVPGMTNHLWFQPTEVGTFDVFCSQYCGLEHSHMLTKIVVLSEEDFAKWHQTKERESVTKTPSRGFELYQEKGCVGCHSLDGSRKIGPSFKDLFGTTEKVMRAGKLQTVTVDETYIRKYVLQPNVDVIEGYPPIMPNIQLTDEQLNSLVAFIKSQSKAGGRPTVTPKSGNQLYQEKGCSACHSTDGTRRVGPSFKDLFGKSEPVTTAGKRHTVVVDEDYLRKYILDPNVDVIEGYPPVMPKIPLEDEEISALIGFIRGLARTAEKPAQSAPAGIQLYLEKGCSGCHSTDGSRRVGPSFMGLLGKTETVLRSGRKETVVVDESYLRKYIRSPNVDVVEGFPAIMPKIGLTDKELDALVEFIKSLK